MYLGFEYYKEKDSVEITLVVKYGITTITYSSTAFSKL